MKLTKLYDTVLRVTSASGWLRKWVIGGKMTGVLEVAGDKADFAAPTNRPFSALFRVTSVSGFSGPYASRLAALVGQSERVLVVLDQARGYSISVTQPDMSGTVAGNVNADWTVITCAGEIKSKGFYAWLIKSATVAGNAVFVSEHEDDGPVDPPAPPDPPTPPNPPDPPTNPARASILSQLLFINATYCWSRLPAMPTALRVWRAGADGRSYELYEVEQDLEPQKRDFFKYYLAQVDEIAPHIEADRKCGLWSRVIMWNANGKPGSKKLLSIDQLMQVFDKWERVIGWEGIIMLACNESDSFTPAATERALYDRARKELPKDRLIAYSKPQPWARFVEHHPQKFDSHPGEHKASVLIASDCGTTLQAMFHGGVFDPTGPKLDKIAEFTKQVKGRGQSLDLYNFLPTLPDDMLKTVCEAFGRRAR